jgi:hypothetical protein
MLMASLTGCGVLMPGPSPVEAPPVCEFPPETELAFAGVTSLGEARLEWTGPPEALNRRGDLYVTAHRISMVAADPRAAPRRQFCLIYSQGDISSAHGTLPDDWQPPH